MFYKRIVQNSLGKNFLMLITATILGKCIGFFREILTAKEFGLSEYFDIYLSISILSAIIVSLLQYGIPNIIIPRLKLKKDVKDKDFYNYFSTHFFCPYIIVLLLIVVLYNIAIGYYVDYLGINPDQRSFAVSIGHLFSIYMFFEALFCILMVMYNAKERFILPAFLHLVLQISVVGALLIFSKTMGVSSIVYGLVAGTIIEVLMFLFVLYKKNILQYFSIGVKYTNTLLKSSAIILLIELIGQLFAFSDRIYIGNLPAGYITGLYYANIIKELPFSVLVITLGNLLLPKFSMKYQNREYLGLISLIRKTLLISAASAVVIVAFILLTKENLIQLLFQRGAFTSENTILISSFLIYYIIGLPFLFIHHPIVKLYYAVKQEKIVFFTTSLSFLIKILLNSYFMSVHFYGGLALATTISFFVNSLVLTIYYSSKIKPNFYRLLR